MDKKQVQPKKTEQELAQAFVEDYQALCEKHGMQIQVTPAWKVSADTGTWSTVLQTAVGKLPKQE